MGRFGEMLFALLLIIKQEILAGHAQDCKVTRQGDVPVCDHCSAADSEAGDLTVLFV